jgi:hypothetical protein
VALRRTAWSEQGMGAAWAWHGYCMASVNETRPHCVNQMGKTHYKPLATRHGRGTAWARHAMCESALWARRAEQLDCPTAHGMHCSLTVCCYLHFLLALFFALLTKFVALKRPTEPRHAARSMTT